MKGLVILAVMSHGLGRGWLTSRCRRTVVCSVVCDRERTPLSDKKKSEREENREEEKCLLTNNE
jgi:hypothetical protein